jgi:nitroimidazol reductase NimA-like FMN-containing flavoprotein (pyridoxamine 5'-phosphate oxidase superfamily)
MSSSPQLRRADRELGEARVGEMLARGYCGRLATISADGTPYIVPLLYVWMDGKVYVHNTIARGHLRQNVDRNASACFEIDEPGEVFAYGRFECDTAVSFRSVIAFGTVRVVEDRDEKTRFCTALMEKYAARVAERPKAFFPRLDLIAVYAMTIERVTGKELPLPALTEQWPATDRTKTPQAVLPAGGGSK